MRQKGINKSLQYETSNDVQLKRQLASASLCLPHSLTRHYWQWDGCKCMAYKQMAMQLLFEHVEGDDYHNAEIEPDEYNTRHAGVQQTEIGVNRMAHHRA